MTHEEMLLLVERLDTREYDLARALAFLRLVVSNNPKKAPDDIVRRRDVQNALGVIDGWLSDARKAMAAVTAETPEAGEIIRSRVRQTLERLEDDTRVLDRIPDWRASATPADTWAARIILRMQWLAEWLHTTAEWTDLKTPYKRWVSRLDPSTCKYCRGLHGVVLPVASSFVTAASRIGYRRAYGGLFAPPLHPRCRCRLVGVTSAEYNRLSLTAA